MIAYNSYLRHRLTSEGIVTLGALSRCVCVRRISLGGEDNALYPVLSNLGLYCVVKWFLYVCCR